MLLLSEVLPLRTTRQLGDYSEDTPLPYVFGDLSSAPFPLIRLSDKRYLAADHPMTVTKVFTAKQVVFDWAVALESDDSNEHTITVVTFSSPIPEGTAVSACGKGILDPDTGELIENPADVEALITRIAGRPEDWSAFRAESSGLRIAGRLFERKPIKTVEDGIAQSVGAMIWHGGARLYPTSADPSPILDLDIGEVTELKASASLTDTADVLRLAYDLSDASGRPLHFIELTASPRRYGGLAKEVVYPYLRTPANAEAIGRPVLQRLAGERYDATFRSDNMSIRPGMWVRPVDHPDWMISGDDPVIMVLQVELDRDNNSVLVKGETLIGQSVVTVTAHSLALPDTIAAAIDVAIQDGVATFTITDAAGRPLAGARVSLDGSAAKTTNAQGKVSFPATPGTHTIAVDAAGYLPFTLTVDL